MCLNYTCIIFIFLICACTCSTCTFVVFASVAVAHGIIVLLKKSISYFMNITYKHLSHVLLKIVTICLVTRADMARDSKPIIGPHVHPYQPSRASISALACTHNGPLSKHDVINIMTSSILC